MPTYVVFNRETGEPVLTHSEPEDVGTSREGLLSMVDPSLDPALLEVVLVDPTDISVGDLYRIDPGTGQLTRAAKGEAGGFGSGGFQGRDPVPITRPSRIVYRREESGSPEAE